MAQQAVGGGIWVSDAPKSPGDIILKVIVNNPNGIKSCLLEDYMSGEEIDSKEFGEILEGDILLTFKFSSTLVDLQSNGDGTTTISLYITDGEDAVTKFNLDLMLPSLIEGDYLVLYDKKLTEDA